MATSIDLPSSHEVGWTDKLNTAVTVVRDAADAAQTTATAALTPASEFVIAMAMAL